MNYDGKVIISTALDNSGLEKGVNSISGSLGGLTKVVAKTTAAIAAAFATAAIAITKQSVDAYADYEQLTGGIETLFKASSSKIKKYAEDAFYTAGVSANKYMEIVTSFSASLISSLGGNTEKAAAVANMALTDMSDNANKMSTAMESIQNAYQGFAKQNYTMLDNLKLGYGGTKTEMERLLKDAKALTGVKYDISNLADVYSAIHAIQEELGITGTTAKEAEKTITGSAKMTEAAWENVLAAIAGGGDLDKAMNNLVYSISKYFENIVPVVQRSLSGIGQLIEGVAPQLVQTVATALIQAIPSLLNAVYQMIVGLANGIYQGIVALFTGNKMTSTVSAQLNGVASSAGAAADAEQDLADGITAAGKAAKKSIAGFDELNMLQDKQSGGAGSTGSASFSSASATVSVDGAAKETAQNIPWLSEIMENIQELIEPLKNIDLTPAKKAFSDLGFVLSDFGGIIAEKLEWAWYNILVPLGEWIIEEAAPAAVETLSAAFEFLGSALEFLSPLFEALWSLIQPLASFIGDVLIGALNGLTTVFSNLSERLNYTVEDAYKMTEAEKNLAESAEKAAEAFDKQRQATEKDEKAVSAEMEYYSDLAKEVMALADEKGRVQKEDEARVKYILGEFKEAFGTESELVDGLITDYSNLKKEILKAIETKKASLLLEANEDDYKAAILGEAEAWDALSLAEKRYTAQKEQSEKTIEKLEEERQEALRMSQIYMENGAWVKSLYAKQDAERIADSIAAEKNRVNELKLEYDKADASYKSHLDTIAEYEKASQLILEGNYDAAIDMLTGKTDAYGAYAGSVEEETDRVLSALEKEVYDTKIAAEKTKKAFDEGVEGIGEDLVTEMHQKYLDALAAFENAKADAEKAGEGFTNGFVDGLKGLKNGVKNAFQKALDSVGAGLSKSGATISSLTPTFAATYSLPTADIPHLAKGSVLPANKPFMAIVGDQRHGTNVEAPLSTIQEAMANVLADFQAGNLAGHEAVVQRLERLISAVEQIEVGDSVIGEAAQRYNRKQAVIYGGFY